ncbi:MAG: anti-sigma factor family protein, partial [Phycisphaeraceae bacterium]
MPEPYDLEKLQAYVEGDMTPEERDAYEREVLANDAGLRELVRDLLADRDALRRLPDESPERELMPEATERAERAMLLGDPEDVPSLRVTGNSADRRHVWTRRLVYSGVAAAVLLAAGVTFYSLQEMGVDDLDQWEHQPLASSESETRRAADDATPGDSASG